MTKRSRNPRWIVRRKSKNTTKPIKHRLCLARTIPFIRGGIPPTTMRKVGRRNGEAAQEVIFIYKRRKRCTRSPRLPVFFHSLRSSLQFSRMGTPQEAPALASTKDGKKGERRRSHFSCAAAQSSPTVPRFI